MGFSSCPYTYQSPALGNNADPATGCAESSMHCRTVQGGKHRICFFPCLSYNYWEVWFISDHLTWIADLTDGCVASIDDASPSASITILRHLHLNMNQKLLVFCFQIKASRYCLLCPQMLLELHLSLLDACFWQLIYRYFAGLHGYCWGSSASNSWQDGGK